MTYSSIFFEKCRRKQIDRTIDELTLFDDDLMARVFANNVSATELLLRVILEDDSIKVISSKGQQEFIGIVGSRTISVDIHAVDGSGREFDVEVQRNTDGTHVRRARYHSSMVDTHMLKEKQKFKDLLDSYVIFICENDKFGKKFPIYHVDRVVRETQRLFEDGSHIIYVNGKYDGDDAIGKLVHDFKCKDSKDMHYKELADSMRHYKETREGRESMCEAFEKLAAEFAKDVNKEWLLEQAREMAKEQVKELVAEKEEKLAEKDEALAEKDEALAEKDEALAEKDEALAEKDEALMRKDAQIAELMKQLEIARKNNL